MDQPLDKIRSQLHLLIPLFVVVAVAVAFGALVNAQFCLLDDPGTIARNPRLDPPSLASLAWYWTHADIDLYVPLTYTLWSALAVVARYSPAPQVYALDPAIFHGANVVLHILSALLAYGILNQLLQDRRAACFGALLLALHPIQVEAVAWASGTKDVLSGMLALAATWSYLAFARQPEKMRDYLLATGLFILALLAKPSAIVLPAVVFVLDYFLLRRPARRIVPWLIPWAVLSVAFGIVAKFVQTPTFVPDVPIWAKPIVAADALGFYLYKLVLPLGMAIDYGRSPSSVTQDGSVILTCLVSVSLMMLVVMYRSRSVELLAAMLIFVAGLAAVLGIVPFEFQRYSTTADHYLYLAMLGPALAAGWFIKRFDVAWARAAASGVLVILGVLTMMQTTVWADDFSLFQHALAVNPDSILARLNLAEAYRLSGQPDRAEPIFRAALERHPDSIEAHEGLSQFLSSVGHLEEAVRIREDEVRVLMDLPPQRRGDIGSLYAALGGDFIAIGHYADAVKYLNLALREDPQNIEATEDLRRAEQALREQSTTRPRTGQGN